MRTLVAGVGYRNLKDLSVGPLLIDAIQQRNWPASVTVEDLSYGPIAILHRLDEEAPFDRMIFVTGVKRDRPAAQIYEYLWQHRLPPEDEIQQRVAEAVTGVISLDNLLIIATYFQKLPREVFVLEVEPRDESWGEELTPEVREVLPELIERIDHLVARPS